MKKLKSFLSASKVNVLIFVLISAMILAATVGGAKAALSYVAETYSSRVEMYSIGVTLLENGDAVTWRNCVDPNTNKWDEKEGVLLRNMLGEGKSFLLGKTYQEELAVQNSGFINEYVRVDIYKYWRDADGKKMQTLSPDLIKLNLLCDATGCDNGWMLDRETLTTERTVLYYSQLVYAESEEGQGGPSVTEAFADTLTIDPSIAAKVTQTTTKENGYTTITTTYDYDGVQFVIEVQPMAIQEHNAQDAIWDIWGRKVTISDGILSLN